MQKESRRGWWAFENSEHLSGWGACYPWRDFGAAKGLMLDRMTLLLPLIRRNLRLLNGLNQQTGDVIVRRVSSEEVEINHDAGRAMFSHWR